jgi:8-oxo-dGTP pyrophosphatase MutT (NUDIX family)
VQTYVPVASVVFTVLVPGPKLLLEERPLTDRVFPGLTIFPGGKLHQDEGIGDALVREVQEELGIRNLVAHPLWKDFVTPYRWPLDSDYKLYPFLITDWDGYLPEWILDTRYPIVYRTIEECMELPGGCCQPIARQIQLSGLL